MIYKSYKEKNIKKKRVKLQNLNFIILINKKKYIELK